MQLCAALTGTLTPQIFFGKTQPCPISWTASNPKFRQETDERAKYVSTGEAREHTTRGEHQKFIFRAPPASYESRASACILLARLSLAEIRDYSQPNLFETHRNLSANVSEFYNDLTCAVPAAQIHHQVQNSQITLIN